MTRRTAVAAPPAEPFDDLFAFLDTMTLGELAAFTKRLRPALVVVFSTTIDIPGPIDWEGPGVEQPLEERPIRGEVGQITGPPIVGTDDTDNAGPAVLGPDEGYVSDVYVGKEKRPGGIRKLERPE